MDHEQRQIFILQAALAVAYAGVVAVLIASEDEDEDLDEGLAEAADTAVQVWFFCLLRDELEQLIRLFG
jgi:hypothetical protein